MKGEVFERTEIKYYLDPGQYQMMRTVLSQAFCEDAYGWQTIRNIYYDNDQNELILHSLEKPIFKQKLRMRCYNIPSENDQVYLELKKKYDGVVYKRRFLLSYRDAKVFHEEEKRLAAPKEQVKDEIAYFIDRHRLKPAVYISYDRLALYCPQNPFLRITFDKNIRYRKENLELHVSGGKQYTTEDMYLMEIKAANAIPLWLADVLSAERIFPCSFSKYGKIFEKESKEHPVNTTKMFPKKGVIYV